MPASEDMRYNGFMLSSRVLGGGGLTNPFIARLESLMTHPFRDTAPLLHSDRGTSNMWVLTTFLPYMTQRAFSISSFPFPRCRAGVIPMEIGNLRKLQYVNLGYNGNGNSLSGEVPVRAFANMPVLAWLSMTDNPDLIGALLLKSPDFRV